MTLKGRVTYLEVNVQPPYPTYIVSKDRDGVEDVHDLVMHQVWLPGK